MNNSHHPNHRPAALVAADEATIAQARQQQLAQASITPALVTTLRHAPPTLYGRFATAYRDLLAMSRARRRKLLRTLGTSLEHADDSALASQAGHTQKGVSMRRLWNTTFHRLGSSLVVVALTLFGLAAPAAAADQVPFTATGTAVITGVTHLPGGLTQLDGSLAGSATHLGNFTGPVTRTEDHQGNFTTTAVFIGANGTNSVFITVSGRFKSTHGSCVSTSTGTYTVTGGTGAFANATGSGTITSQIDQCAGTAIGTYTGTISQPHSG